METWKIYQKKSWNMAKPFGAGRVTIKPAIILGFNDKYILWAHWESVGLKENKRDVWYTYVHDRKMIDSSYERDWELGGELNSEQAEKLIELVFDVDFRGNPWTEKMEKYGL